MDTEAALVEGVCVPPSDLGVLPRPGPRLVLSILVCLCMTVVCHARVTCVRLTCDHIADATEVWYDDSWHYFDVDIRGVLLRPDGMVAGLGEAQSRRGLWTDPPLPVEPFFPKDQDKAKISDIYKDSPVPYYYRWFEMGHTMDFYLRQGESFTRFWNPQDGRWHHLERYGKTKWIRDLIEQEPRGPKPNHRDFTRWNHGNGLFEYVPQEDLRIVHGYRLDGKLMSAERAVTGPTSYTLECSEEPVDVYLKMEVPHQNALANESSIRPYDRAEKALKKIQPFFRPPAEFAGDFSTYKSPLEFDDGTRVNTPADWQRRRNEILAYWREVTGSWPALIEKPKVQYSEQEHRDNFTQHRIFVEIAPDKQTTGGYLLVPDGEGPFPAVLVVYYDAETGAGLGKELRDFGYQLAKRGFVALSIGTPEFCSLKSPYKPLCKQSEEASPLQPLSALAYVAANCHKALANMPNVDAERIGIIGHSYGGKWAMFASCLYEEFACAVWSDPGIVFDESRPNINYWEPWYLGYEPNHQRQRGVPSNTNPRTGAYKELAEKGHDLHELHALMAPRPFLVSGGAEDPPKRWKALNHTIAVNRLLGYTNRVAITSRDSHEPTAESNAQIYLFFDHFLRASK